MTEVVVVGAMADDLTMKLILDAVNKMSPQVDQATKDIDKVTQAVDTLQKHGEHMQSSMKVAMNGSLFDPKTWSALMKDSQAFQMRMDMLQQNGFNAMMVGGAMLAPVVGAVKAAGDLGEIMDQIKIDVYDSQDSSEQWAEKLAKLRDITVGLSQDVKYGSALVGDAVDSLVRGNVAVEDVVNGAAKASVYLAQASRDQVSTAAAAEAVAKLGNAWQLTGKELEGVADTLARVDAASTASIPDLIEGFKYVSSSASNLKIPVQDVAVSLGVLNNAGIDASTAGTTLNMLLQNLQPTSKAAKEAFDALGLSVEKNPFYDVNGRLRPMVEVIRILRGSMKDMTDQQKQLALKSIFDERGSRAVIALVKEGKNSFEDIESSLAKQMSLWDRIKTQNQGLNVQLEILKSNFTTLFGEAGSPTAQGMIDFIKRANDATVAVTEWSKAHPGVTSGLMETLGAVGSLTVGIGALQLSVAALAKVWLPLLRSPLAWPLIGGAAGFGIAAGLNKLFEWTDKHLPGGEQYERDKWERQKAEDAQLREQIKNKPASFQPARVQKSIPGLPGFTYPAVAPTVNNITIYARDAQETADHVQRAINQPTSVRYVNSRMPVRVEG